MNSNHQSLSKSDTTWALIALIGLILASCTLAEHLVNVFTIDGAYVNADNGQEVHLNSVVKADACSDSQSVCLTDVYLIVGEINDTAVDGLEKLLANQGKGKESTLCFVSPGGHAKSAIRLMQIIKSNKLRTCIAEKYILPGMGKITPSVCASACPLVFLSASERIVVGSNHIFGIHSPGISFSICFCEFNLEPPEFLVRDSIDEIRLALKNDPTVDIEYHLDLFNDSLKTPYADVALLSFEQMTKYKVFTRNLN